MLEGGATLRVEWQPIAANAKSRAHSNGVVSDVATRDVHSIYWANHLENFGKVEMTEDFQTLKVKQYVRAGNLGKSSFWTAQFSLMLMQAIAL